jgi:hypothetical protein
MLLAFATGGIINVLLFILIVVVILWVIRAFIGRI